MPQEPPLNDLPLAQLVQGGTMDEPRVGIIMGSRSDWETMRHAAETLDSLGVSYETRVVSAHRTPQRLYDYATSARDRGLKLIIAGAGGAAHLPGMAASMTPLASGFNESLIQSASFFPSMAAVTA